MPAQLTSDRAGDQRIKHLEEMARQIRVLCLKTAGHAGVGHLGGALSAAEIMSALYFDVLRLNPQEPGWPFRDRFVLSKGHTCLAQYAALTLKGFFPAEWLDTFAQEGSRLQKHPDCHKTPGIDFSTGSLGQGASVAVGMALAGMLDARDYRVYALLGDGELDEGQVWEAAMAASHYHLDNLVFIVDANQLQLDGPVENIMSIEPMAQKWEAFGWETREIDGHCVRGVRHALATPAESNRPVVVIARTIKGKGVSFMEGAVNYHSDVPDATKLAQALRELGESNGQ